MIKIIKQNDLKEESASSETNNNQQALCDINSLPVEILLHIFKYLPCRTTACVLTKVCPEWEAVCKDGTLYRDLRFKGSTPSTKKALVILGLAGQELRTLELVNRRDGNKLLKHVGSNNLQIKSLIVINCQGTEDDMFISCYEMLRIVTKCRYLKLLRFKHTLTSCGPAFFNRLEFLPELTNFQPGTLRSTFRHSSINVMTTISNYCRGVEELRLFYGREDRYNKLVTNTNLFHLIQNHRNTLKTLKINARQITNNSMQYIASCQSLTSLRLRYLRRVDGEGIRRLGVLRNLKALSVSNNYKISHDDWGNLFMKPELRSLTKLKLIRCEGINDEVFAIIGKFLTNLRLLRVINCVNVTDDGIRTIQELLPWSRITILTK